MPVPRSSVDAPIAMARVQQPVWPEAAEATATRLEDALAKMDAGTYGECESCGQAIAAARLEAKPAARLCITCASKPR